MIASRAIADRLRHVTQAEGISADESALSILAREAAGSMRDAMSLLDQVIAWGGDSLEGADVARVLGVASHRVLHDIAGSLVRGDAAKALGVVAELAGQGHDIAHVTRDLLALMRDIVVAKVCAEPGDLIDLADDERRDVMELAKSTDADDLLRLHQGFSQGFDDVVRSGQPRAALEMLLVRLARRPPLLPIDDLIGRLRELERRLGSAPRREPPREGPPGLSGARPPEARPRPREPRSSEGPGAPRDRRDEPPPARPQPNPAPAPAPASARPRADPEPEERSADFATVAFIGILERLATVRPELAAFYQHAAPLSVTPTELVVGFEPDSVIATQASEKEAVAALTQAASDHFGARVHVVVELDSERSRGFDTVAAQQARERKSRVQRAIAKAKQHPRVVDAMEILGARIKDLKIASD